MSEGGSLPDGWVSIPLGKLGTFANGINKNAGDFGFGVPFVNLLDVFGVSVIADYPPGLVNATRNEIERYSLKVNDVLFIRSSVKPSGVGLTALVARTLDNTVYSGFLIRFRPEPNRFAADFLRHCFYNDDFRQKLISKSTVSANTNINQESLRQIETTLPPINEQREIAEILSTLDEAIEQTEALIAKYQQIKAGLMHDLFTRGVTLDGKLRPTRAEAPELYKESPLGWIPKEWEVFTVGELFSRRSERGKVGLPIMSITMSSGLVERDSVDRRVETNLSPQDHLLVRQGDIAYNMMRMWQGVLGRALYDCLVSPAYIVLAPNSVIDSLFGEYLLSTDTAVAKFKRLSYGVVDDRLRLYFRDIVRIRFGIPRDMNEQLAIAKRLTTMDETILRTGASVEKLRQQKHGLMHDFLTGRVRVKVAESAAA